MSKNGNITSFFKPVPKTSSSQQSGSASQQSGSASQQILSPHRRELPMIASPSRRTPPPPSSPFPASPLVLRQSPAVKAVRDRNAVIRGSDDEDSDDLLSSDDDLPSFFSKPKTAIPVPASRKDLNLCATPKAKRTALALYSSPLNSQPKHKFDWNALMKHAQADDALEDSEHRMEIALADGSPTSAGKKSNLSDGIDGSGKKDSASLHDRMLDVLSDPDDSQDEGHREKVLRAVKRSQATPSRKEYHFFDNPPQENPMSPGTIGVRGSFPKAVAKGPWKFLAKDQGRADLFEDGVPFLVQSKLNNLPDEIYSWVLLEIPAVKSTRLREEYLRLLEKCPDHAGQLIDENLIVKFFRDLGASERALDMTSRSKPYAKSTERSYNSSSISNSDGQRDWTGLLAVLEILSRTSEALTLRSLTSSIALLLRLGMDRVVREDPDVASEYQETFWWLVKAIPMGCWDKTCFDVTTSIYDHVPEYTLRWDAVSSIPLTHPRLLDLRRRLAIAFLFDDPKRGQLPPDETFSIRAVIDRMDSDDTGIFTVDRRQQTDFFELASLIELLAIAIGDGNHPPQNSAYPSSERQYNADVDELSKRLKIMTSNIHDQGAAYVSRLEAKGVLKDVERKLQYLTRTRPPPKASIFGIKTRAEDLEEEDAEQKPRQRKFMERFFVGKAGGGAAKEGDVDNTEREREREREQSPSLPSMARVSRRVK